MSFKSAHPRGLSRTECAEATPHPQQVPLTLLAETAPVSPIRNPIEAWCLSVIQKSSEDHYGSSGHYGSSEGYYEGSETSGISDQDLYPVSPNLREPMYLQPRICSPARYAGSSFPELIDSDAEACGLWKDNVNVMKQVSADDSTMCESNLESLRQVSNESMPTDDGGGSDPSGQDLCPFAEMTGVDERNSCGPRAYKMFPTTLMIRNIPRQYTQTELAREWHNNGTWDFLHLPMNSSLSGNKCYAFVNFTSPDAAITFKNFWNKRRLPLYRSRRSLTISCADVQGRDNNLWPLRKGQQWRIKNADCQTLIYDNGVQVSLEEALRKLNARIPEPSLPNSPRGCLESSVSYSL